MTEAPAENVAMHTPSARRIARSAIMVIGILAFGKMFSLAEKWVGLDRFGVGIDWDTFSTANQLPEQLYSLISGGALAYAFIPIFGGLLGKGQRETAWKLASNVVNTVFLAALSLSVIVFLAAPWLVAHVLAPGFASPYLDVNAIHHPFNGQLMARLAHPDLVMQTASLIRILLLSLMLFSVSGLCAGILHTHQSFLWPALAPILFDVGNLFGVAVLARRFGIYGAAMGAVMGAGLHLLIQVPGLIRYRARWYPYLDWRNKDLRDVLKLMIPRAVGLSLANLNLLIAYSIASTLGAGASSAFNRGYSLMQLPQTLIGTAMGIVIFPTLALLSAAGDLKGKRAAMSGSLRFILIASIPAALMMIIAGRPLVGVLEGGAFDPAGAERVFGVLQLFALGIITQSGVEIVARSFYADKDMIVPLMVQVIAVSVNVILALLLVKVFQAGGLALANSLAVGLELLILTFILRRRWHGIGGVALLTTTIKALIAAAVMGAAMLIVGPIISSINLPLDRRLVQLFHAGAQILVGLVVYLVMALLLRMEEIRELPRLVLRRRGAVADAAPTIPVTGD
jgi:putative peptidoglycan lipid II flippase